MPPVPVISVVIPTRNRPDLVSVAVASALNQTFTHLEVIVVIDGPDPDTLTQLQRIPDPRLRVLPLATSVGAAEARNLGVNAAHGAWIAFLDDDDEWLPGKLERQSNIARSSQASIPIVCGAYWARQEGRDTLFGRRRPRLDEEPLSEYMFCRRSFTYGENALATSVLLVPRSLMLEVPFDPTLKKHQDWDWALRALAHPHTTLLYIPEPLSIYNMPLGTARISASPDWQASLTWAQQRRHLLTPRAFAAFVTTECLTRATRSGATLPQRLTLVRTILEEGEPAPRTLAMMLTILLTPTTLRTKLRNLLR